MKISKIMIATLVLASLSSLAQDKPKYDDKPKQKVHIKKTDERTAKKDSVKNNKAEPKHEKWNCPPCGMG